MNSELPPQCRQSRLSICLCYVVLGFELGIWGAMVPLITSRLALSPLDISLFLLLLGMTLLISAMLLPRIMQHVGSRTLIKVGMPLYVAGFVLILLAPNTAIFFLAAALTGLASGFLDGTINIQAVEWEVSSKRKMLCVFHGMYTVGVMIGAGYWLACKNFGLSPLEALVPLLVILPCAIIYRARWLLEDNKQQQQQKQQTSDQSTQSTQLSLGLSVVIGVLILATNTVEGGMIDWSALFLTHDLSLKDDLAGVGVALFAACMAIGRLSGDWLANYLSISQLLGWPVLIAANLLVLAVFQQSVVLSLLAFACLGLAIANVFPVLLRLLSAQLDAVTRVKAVARVIGFSYFGIITGPVLFGLIAEYYSYSATMYTIALLLVFFALLLYFMITKRRLNPTGTLIKT